MRSDPRLASLLIAVLALVVAGGCQRQVLPSSAVNEFPSADDELDFLDAVYRMTAVTNDDALHGLFLLADGDDPHPDYEARVAAAKARKWMPSGFDRPANESAQIGWMAMAGCEICGVKGGLTMLVIGPTPRYCTRELVYLRVLPLRTENQSLTGPEFTDYLNRLQRLRAGRREPGPPTPQSLGPSGEQSATPMDEADVMEGLPSPDGGGTSVLREPSSASPSPVPGAP